ncbi:putative pentatricopeptide repeat-containing protein At1g64310 [Magnolia sinica]|uniref:putative pentatricopeptide repeat-containing protein At1g64310 n=1 Tax=Magnolia sinica TaxID=86752 RepID=UPI002659D015|nr:putative pentatricopeptide repeat-containing protein At1g64310 [Magnolia sinica]
MGVALFPSLLSELSQSHQTLLKTKQLHSIIVKSNLSNDPFFVTKILRFYAINNNLLSARRLFDKTPHRTVYLWNSMIRAYAWAHEFVRSFTLFTHMRSSETKPDNFTFACILRASSDQSDRAGMKMVHGCTIVSGLESDSVIGSALVSAYSKLGLVDDACSVFEGMLEPDLVLWNSMVSGYGHNGFWHQGLRLLSRMRNLGKMPDGYTLVGLISCFYNPCLVEIGQGIHGLCLKTGFDSNAHVGSALVSMYARCDCLNSAYRVFNRLANRDLVSWSALITGFSNSGKCVEAMVLFTEMNITGQRADPILIASLLSACAWLVMVGPGKEVHAHVFRRGFEFDVMVSSALIDMYAKCGFPDLGLQVFKMAPKRNVVSYNSVITGLGAHGFGRQAIEVFEEMLQKGFKPDQSTFSALLSACCHGGLVRNGKEFFRRMECEFGITPGNEHYVYMVKLLGTAGELEDAYNLIRHMPISPDSGVLGALLSGCSIHGNSKMGEIVAHQLFKIKPEKAAYRVMLSNMYAVDGRWNDVRILRDKMLEGGLRKIPGLSWIEKSNV